MTPAVSSPSLRLLRPLLTMRHSSSFRFHQYHARIVAPLSSLSCRSGYCCSSSCHTLARADHFTRPTRVQAKKEWIDSTTITTATTTATTNTPFPSSFPRATLPPPPSSSTLVRCWSAAPSQSPSPSLPSSLSSSSPPLSTATTADSSGEEHEKKSGERRRRQRPTRQRRRLRRQQQRLLLQQQQEQQQQRTQQERWPQQSHHLPQLLRPSPYDRISSPLSSSASVDWRDWLRGEEYVDVWEIQTEAETRANAKKGSKKRGAKGGDGAEVAAVEALAYDSLDVPTRHLIELLDDAADGRRKDIDWPTTRRCNRAIELLSDTSIGGKSLTGRALRADAILRRMIRCERAYNQRRMQRNSAADCNGGSIGFGIGGDSSVQTPSLNNVDNPLVRYYDPPFPDIRTYMSVLRLYATESGPGHAVASRAEVLAEEMVSRFGIRKKAAVWNQALSCWAVSTDGDKSVRAAAFLAKIKARQKQEREQEKMVMKGKEDGSVTTNKTDGIRSESGSGEKNDGGGDDEEEEGFSHFDASSYGHVLRACALSDNVDVNDNGGAPSRAADVTTLPPSRLGAEVALRVWPDYARSGLPVTSHAVSQLLRSVRHLPLPNADRGRRVVHDAFVRCREAGAVNAHVMHELKLTAEALLIPVSGTKVEDEKEERKKTKKKISGGDNDDDDDVDLSILVGEKAARALADGAREISLLRKLPREWTRNAKTNTKWGW